MKRISILVLFMATTALAKNHVEISKDEIIVKFKPQLMNQFSMSALSMDENISGFLSLATGQPVNDAKVLSKTGNSVVALLKFDQSAGEVESLSTSMQTQNPLIEWAHPNRIYHGEYREGLRASDFNDPKIKEQTHLPQIDAFSALAIQAGRKEVILAVTDDGFDLDHEDLKDIWHVNRKEIPNNGIDDDNNGYVDDVVGWNFAGKNNNPDYGNGHGGHGTHIAGIIAGMPNNGKGIIGVAPGIKVMPLKFYGGGQWTSAIVYETYAYAVANGARIINTSYNVNAMSRDPIYVNAVKLAHDNGVLVFNSAGNSGEKDPERSRLDTYFLVASVAASANEISRDKKSGFSNYGWQIDIAAPGGNIMATAPNDQYVDMSGTSMASPMAAAMAGLIWSQFPNMDARQVTHILTTSVDDIYKKNARYVHGLGFGRINAHKMVDQVADPLQLFIPELQKTRNPVVKSSNNSFTIRFRGSPGAAPRPIGIISVDHQKGSKVRRRMRIQQNINLGTNQISYKYDALPAGQYAIVVPQDSFLDPFGNHMDGDYDGRPGGNLVIPFTVE